MPDVSKMSLIGFFYKLKQLEPIFVIFGSQYPENHIFQTHT